MCCVMVREKMSWEANLQSFLASQQSLDWSQLLSHVHRWEREQRHELRELNTRGWTVRPRALAGDTVTRWVIKSSKKCLVGYDGNGHDGAHVSPQRRLWWSFRLFCWSSPPRALCWGPARAFPGPGLLWNRTSAWSCGPPYLCVGGREEESSELVYIVLLKVFYPQFKQESLNNDNEHRLNARLTQPFAKGPSNIDSYMQFFSLICLVLCILDWVVCFNVDLDKSLHLIAILNNL